VSYTKKQILYELRNHHTQLLSFADALDTKLNGLAQAAVVILSVFAVVGTLSTASLWFWVALGLAAILYMIGAVISVSGLTPRDYAFPLEAKWDSLASVYFHRDEADMRDTLISQYIKSIDMIKPILAAKSTCVTAGTITLSTTVTVLIILLVVTMVAA